MEKPGISGIMDKTHIKTHKRTNMTGQKRKMKAADISYRAKKPHWFRILLLPILAALFFTGCRQGSAVEKAGIETPEKALPYNTEGIGFSHDSGIYKEKSLTVTIMAPEGCTLALTTDGTEPAASDDTHLAVVRVTLESASGHYLMEHKDLMLYPEFPQINMYESDRLPSGRVLNVAPVDSAGKIGNTVSKVYFLDTDLYKRFPDCLILSVTVDPDDLLNYDDGILAAGAVYDRWKKTDQGQRMIENDEWWNLESNSTQRGSDWERPCRLQIYDGAQNPTVEISAGIRVRGGASRRLAQKSFNLYFRDQYEGKLRYSLYPEAGKYRSITLRSGGNDMEYTKFKDVFLQSLAADRNLTVLQSRPAILFLNGEYWGPYCLNEKLSASFFQSRYGIDGDQVVAVKGGELEAGEEKDLKLFDDLMEFADLDLSQAEVYRRFCETVDVQSMADYYAVRIYIGSGDDYDKPGVKDYFVLWRTKDSSYNGGRWMFVLYDMEYSAGHYNEEKTAPETDHFRMALEYSPLFAAAMKNSDFRKLFLRTFEEIAADYNIERVRTKIQPYVDLWQPLMSDFYLRYGDTSWGWDDGLNAMLSFFEKRADIIIPIVRECCAAQSA